MTARAAFVLMLAWHFVAGSSALGQAPREPLRVAGLSPGGAGLAATSSWQSFDVNVTNLTDTDRQALVVVFFQDQPGVQYGRNLWVPAGSALSTWMLVGPAPIPTKGKICDVESLIYNRTAEADQLLLPPTEERIRVRGILYRKREPTTVMLLDEEEAELGAVGRLPRPESAVDEALHLARTFRQVRGLSELVPMVRPGPLPPIPEALEGVDHIIIASDRLRHDPVGAAALRQWLARGGAVWVMLDMVDPQSIAPLLGSALDFEVVDRVTLTEIQLGTRAQNPKELPDSAQSHERPVALARVALPPGEEAAHTVNGWPAWFTRKVGRGRVVFTTLGPRGWYRPRRGSDPRSPFTNFPMLPVALPPLEALADAVYPPPEEHPFRVESFQPMLAAEIGYSVVSRATVIWTLTAFLGAAVAAGIVLRKAARPELLGWLGPLAAAAATALILVQGRAARQAAAPSVAVAQIVHPLPGVEEAAAHGLLALYRPESGPVPLGAERGGLFDLDMAGIEQMRRFLVTDIDVWRWDNVSLPAGVRLGPCRGTLPLPKPVGATARFGPDGLEGRLAAEGFEGLSDAILTTASVRTLAVRVGQNGSLHAGSQDVLPEGQFIAGAVLSDEQQRRQQLYREFVKKRRTARSNETEHTMLVWAHPAESHFDFGAGVQGRGNMLMVIPVRLARTPAGLPMTIPAPLVTVRRILDERSTIPTWEADVPADMHLRFQLPRAALPMKVERARLSIKIDAPSRRVTVSSWAETKQVERYRADSPLETIHVDVADAAHLRLDPEGGLHFNLSISDELAGPKVDRRGAAQDKWVIRNLELEVSGRAE